MCATFTAYLHNKHNRMPYLFAYINTIRQYQERENENRWSEIMAENAVCTETETARVSYLAHWNARFVIMPTTDVVVLVLVSVCVWMPKFAGLLLISVYLWIVPNGQSCHAFKWNAIFVLSLLVTKFSNTNNETLGKIQHTQKLHQLTFHLCIILAFLLFASFVWMSESHCYVAVNCFGRLPSVVPKWMKNRTNNSTCWLDTRTSISFSLHTMELLTMHYSDGRLDII